MRKITELSTKVLQSDYNLPGLWPKGKHNFTYSFDYPQELARQLRSYYPNSNYFKIYFSITERIVELIFDYLPTVANIHFTPAKTNELADFHFLSTNFTPIALGEVTGRADSITTFCNKFSRVVISIDDSHGKFWQKTCLSSGRERNIPVCINNILHELMHGLGWFHHPWEGSVVLGEKDNSQNTTVLSYTLPKLYTNQYYRRILFEEDVLFNSLTLTPLDALALRERYGPPANILSGNFTINFYRDNYFYFPWMNRFYGMLYGIYFKYYKDWSNHEFRVRQRVTFPEGKNLTLIINQDSAMVIDTRRGSLYPTYIRDCTNNFLQFLPETDIVYQLGCYTFIVRIVASGPGEKSIYDHSGNVEYVLNSAKTTLFLSRNSGHDVIRGFDPEAHTIVKDCSISSKIMFKGNDTIIQLGNNSLTLLNATGNFTNNMQCQEMADFKGECANIQLDSAITDRAAIDHIDDFCLTEQIYLSVLNFGIALSYGFAVSCLQAIITTLLLKMKMPVWGIILANEFLMTAITLAKSEPSLLLILLLLLRPTLTAIRVSHETINVFESTLSYSLINLETRSTLSQITACGACMFGAWAGQKIYQRAAVLLESSNKESDPNRLASATQNNRS